MRERSIARVRAERSREEKTTKKVLPAKSPQPVTMKSKRHPTRRLTGPAGTLRFLSLSPSVPGARSE